MEGPPVAPSAAASRQGGRQGGRQGWVPGFLLGALVFALGAGGAVLTKPIWDPAGEAGGAADGPLAQQLAALQGRLAELEARPADADLPKNLATADDVARLEGQITALSAADATQDLAAEVKDLKARMTAMSASASAGAEAASAVGGLSGEVASIKATQTELSAAVDDLKARDAGKDALLWSAVGALRDALRYAGPFDAQLDDVTRLAGDRAEFQDALAELKPLADSGVPSLAELQRTFPATARDVVAAGYGASEDGVLGDVLNRVSQVVTVRPVGEVEGDSSGAIVARAEGHLDQGDLAAALDELKGLSETAAAAAAPWRARAEQRLAADAAITKLNGLLAGQLAAGG
jgi:uroporphyrinogen-III synthase